MSAADGLPFLVETTKVERVRAIVYATSREEAQEKAEKGLMTAVDAVSGTTVDSVTLIPPAKLAAA